MPSFADHHSGFVLPNARFNPAAQTPSCSGLLTPPESPKSGYARQLPTPKSTQCPAPTHEYRKMPPSSSLASLEPEPQSAQHDLSRVSETIYTIIEQVIEQKLAEAMGPLRLNLRRMDSENLEFQEQNGALGKQNDHLGNQVRRLEDQVNAQLQTVQNISAATSSSLEVISALVNQLSDTTSFIQKAHGINDGHITFRPAPSALHQHQQHYHIQPQFCFESRSAKRHHQSQKKSKKPRLVKYMLSKWRTGGASD